MIMTGKNGKESTKNQSNKIILIDSSVDTTSLNKIIQDNPDSKIITFDYESHSNLNGLGIRHYVSDESLTDRDLDKLQNEIFRLLYWYNSSEITDEINYNGVNFGRLFHEQTIVYLVKFLKSFHEINLIYEKNPNSLFIATGSLFELMKSKTNSIQKIEDTSKAESSFYSDNVRVNIKLGNRYYMFFISRSLYQKIKRIADAILYFSFGAKNNHNLNSCLLVEFPTTRYGHFFRESKNVGINLTFYARRRPAIWNFESYKIIKNSTCKMITPKSLTDNKFRNDFEIIRDQIQLKLNNLWKKESFFSKHFVYEGQTIWQFIGPILKNLIEKRISEIANEILLAKNLFQKFSFSSILVLHEIGLTEQIITAEAKIKKIPIILLHLGHHFDTPEAKIHNVSGSVYPINADKFVVWGNIGREDAIKNGEIPESKIITIGSPRYDNINSYDKVSEENFILLALPGPWDMNVRGQFIKNIENYIESIKQICHIVTKNHLNLIIKPHNAANDIDIRKIVYEINQEIKIVTTGDILPLIKSCKFMILMGNSTSLLEAQLLKKPVIYIPAIDAKFGTPSYLKTNSCAISDIDKLEDILLRMNTDENYRNEIIERGSKYVNNYIYNQGTSSLKLLKFLQSLSN